MSNSVRVKIEPLKDGLELIKYCCDGVSTARKLTVEEQDAFYWRIRSIDHLMNIYNRFGIPMKTVSLTYVIQGYLVDEPVLEAGIKQTVFRIFLETMEEKFEK